MEFDERVIESGGDAQRFLRFACRQDNGVRLEASRVEGLSNGGRVGGDIFVGDDDRESAPATRACQVAQAILWIVRNDYVVAAGTQVHSFCCGGHDYLAVRGRHAGTEDSKAETKQEGNPQLISAPTTASYCSR